MILLLPVISAWLLYFSFPPEGPSYLVWFSFVPLFYFAKHFRLNKKNFWQLLVFGLVFFGAYLFWLNVLEEWVGFWAFGSWIFLAVYLSFFYGLAIFLTAVFYKNLKPIFFLLACPAVWVMVEWLRSCGQYGLTLGNFALTQYQNLPLLRIAAWAGIYGINYVIILANVLIFLALEKIIWGRSFSIKILGFGLSLLISFIWAANFSNGQKIASASNFIVAGIQPNISQKDKLNPNKLEENFEKELGLSTDLIGNLSRKNKAQIDLIVWPESLPVVLYENHPFFKKLSRLAQTSKTAVLVGAFQEKNGQLYNSALLISPEGQLVDFYRKHQVVPFGEYLPLRPIFYPFLKGIGFLEQDLARAPLKTITWQGRTLGAGICFESTFPGLLRSLARKGAEVFFILTNDAWFQNSTGALAHFIFLPFRAVETGRYFLQVANTGISGLVAPNGRIIFHTGLNQKETLLVKMPLIQKKTFYTKYGDWLVFLSWVMILLGLFQKKGSNF